MEAKDLRIGNLIGLNGKAPVLTVCNEIIKYIDETGASEKYQPIPLTEKWLKKIKEIYLEQKIEPYDNKYAGFLKINENIGLCFSNNHINSSEVDVYLQVKMNDKEGNRILIRLDIKYVHQLQNYYYCNKLTGEELTIKD